MEGVRVWHRDELAKTVGSNTPAALQEFVVADLRRVIEGLVKVYDAFGVFVCFVVFFFFSLFNWASVSHILIGLFVRCVFVTLSCIFIWAPVLYSGLVWQC